MLIDDQCQTISHLGSILLSCTNMIFPWKEKRLRIFAFEVIYMHNSSIRMHAAYNLRPSIVFLTVPCKNSVFCCFLPACLCYPFINVISIHCDCCCCCYQPLTSSYFHYVRMVLYQQFIPTVPVSRWCLPSETQMFHHSLTTAQIRLRSS